MPLPLPHLDDHDYADLVEMARSLIPTECPEWTDHNPSDTGIILLELFAWLTELLLYRVNQVPDQSQIAFLKLLNGSNWEAKPDTPLKLQIRDTVIQLRDRYRAVTVDDYEHLILNRWTQTQEAQVLTEGIARVKAFTNLDLDNESLSDIKGHISIVVLPNISPLMLEHVNAQAFPEPSETLKRSIWMFLDPRRLLTIHHHVVGPFYQDVAISATLHLKEGSLKKSVQQNAKYTLWKFFHPLTGGETGKGWPFGRSVYLSEVYQQLDQVEGVDYVSRVTLNNQTSQKSIPLAPHQLVRLARENIQLTVKQAWEKADG